MSVLPTKPNSAAPDGGSFRDRDSRVFHVDGAVVRGLTDEGLADWRAFSESGLLESLVSDGDLVDTVEADETLDRLRSLDPAGEWVAALRHEPVPVVSYPYEWSFGMLKDAALLQLRLTRHALSAGLALKDATPYNVQWHGAHPVFIDIGSFERARQGEPWLGYRQFCMQFLYPLLLQAYTGVPFQPWLRGSLEGIPPADASALLKGRRRLKAGVIRHVALHARLERSHADSSANIRKELRDAGFNQELIEANLRGLEKLVRKVELPRVKSEWSEYSTTCGYTEAETEAKESFVRRVVAARRRALVWDLGCNDGRYSRIAADSADYVVALDADLRVVDQLYSALKAEGARTILPLYGDIADPSPGLGWRGGERQTLVERGAPDLILALALVHHLAISRTVPLRELVDWFAELGSELVIEFPHRDDPMVQRLLARKREGSHPEYGREAFEAILRSRYDVVDVSELPSGTRTLYHAVLR